MESRPSEVLNIYRTPSCTPSLNAHLHAKIPLQKWSQSYHLLLHMAIATAIVVQTVPQSPKINPTLKNMLTPSFFFNGGAAKGTFLLKVCQPIYAAVHSVMSSKKHQRSSTVQEVGLTNEGRHHLLLTKCMTKEALQNHCMQT